MLFGVKRFIDRAEQVEKLTGLDRENNGRAGFHRLRIVG